MQLSYKELFYISKELLAEGNLYSLLNKINVIFGTYLNIKTWSIVIRPINTIYFFHEGNLTYLDNYKRETLDWIEFDDMFYSFNQEQSRDILSLIDEISLKLNKKFIDVSINEQSKVELFNPTLGLIEIYNRDNELEVSEELIEVINISINNIVTYKKLIELNKKDSLTGLYNYKEFYKILNDEIDISSKNNKKFSIVFIDIDNFKNVNDINGHLTGSKILIEFGNILLLDIRHKDCVTRYGGDEYILLLRDTGKDEAVSVSKRLLRLISENEFTTENGNSINITASMGISTYPGDGKDKNDLIAVADNNMYLAKKGSKNGVKW